MGKALTYIGGALLALLSALLLVPYAIDWNGYRGAFEEEASRALGREVRVGGKINLKLLPTPYVSFEQIRVSDTSGTLGAPFFRVDSFTMGLAIAPLLRGALEATHMELRRPVLTLAIDGDGRGNWRDVTLSPAAAAVLPGEVKLNAVDIVDGTVAVRGGDGDLLRLTGVTGELSADSLKGPFKFRGHLTWQGEVRELRFSTAETEANGDLRFKSFVRVPRSAAAYTLDGKLSDIAGQLRLEGELGMRAPLTAGAGDRQAQSEMLDVRTKVDGNALGVGLGDIVVAFDQGGQPQIISGAGEVHWRDGLRVKLALVSRWLDLDRIAGASSGHPIDAVHALVPTIVRLLPESGQVDARLGIEQTNLGGEVASNLRLHVERFRGPMLLRELYAELPGGTRLDLNGTLTVAGDAAFAGDISARGTSFARFLAWAAKGQTVVDTRSDGPFAVQGRLGLTGTGLELGNLTAELLSAPPLTGSVAYRWPDRRRLEVNLAGRELDLAPVLADALDPGRITALLWPDRAGGSPGGAPPRLPSWLDGRTTDASISLKIARLSDAQRHLSDVDATFALEQNRLQVTRIQLTTPEGTRLDVDGEVAGLDSAPKGRLSGTLVAVTPTALDGLLRALGNTAKEQDRTHAARLERLVPLNLAGSLRIGTEAGQSELSVDGTVRASRASGRLRLAASPSGWRDAPAELAARIDDADAAMAAVELAVGQDGQATRLALPRGGQLRLKAVGRPRAGMVITADLVGDKLAMGLEGSLRAPQAGQVEYDGIVRLMLPRAEPILAMAGLAGIAPLADVPIAGALEVSAKPDALHLRPLGLAVAGIPVGGLIALTRLDDKASRVDAAVDLPQAGLPQLMSAILDGGRTRPGAGGDARAARGAATYGPPAPSEGPWPEQAFDFSVLSSLQGRVRINIGRLAIEPGLELADASIDMELAPDQLRITNLDGRMLDGAMKARLVLEKAPLAGYTVVGALRVDEARLEAIAGRHAASGSAGLLMQFSGRALSPQALVASLQGKGELTLAAGQLNRLSPSTLPRTIAAVLDGKLEMAGDTVRRMLIEGLRTPAAVRIAPAKVPLQILNGALRIGNVGFETEDGRGSVTNTIDLVALKIDSAWRLEAKPVARAAAASQVGQAERTAPPEVGVVYVGPIANLAALEPRFSTDAFERVLTVWRMERDVAELERLRQEDEERIRREQERQRTFDLERQRLRESQQSPTGAQPAPAAAVLPPPLPPPPTRPGALGVTGVQTPSALRAVPPPSGPGSPAPPLPPDRGPEAPPARATAPATSPLPPPPAAVSAPGVAVPPVAGGGPVAEGAAQEQPPAPVEGERRPPLRPGPPRPPRPPAFNPFPALPN